MRWNPCDRTDNRVDHELIERARIAAERKRRIEEAAPDMLAFIRMFSMRVREFEGTQIEFSVATALTELLRRADELVKKAEGQ